jgi:DNA-binding transcriptional LysR family regulator
LLRQFDVNLRHLEVFREVMRTNSVTKAAYNLGRTQPAISACIASLEREIGYALFERKNGRLHPVPEAHYLLGESAEILRKVGALERSMKSSEGLVANQLHIVSMPILAEFFMPRLISRFVGTYPNTRFLVFSASSPEVYEHVASQQFDVGLAEKSPGSDLVNAEPIEVDCICALPASSPLAGRQYVTPEDLDGEPCCTYRPEHFIARRMKEIFAEAGARLNNQFEFQNAAAQYSLVANGIAYGVFSPLSAWIYKNTHQNPTAIAFVPIRPVVPYPFAVLTPTHKPLSRLARAFVAELRNELDAVLADIASVLPSRTQRPGG